ncbi:hypothetical protein J6590_010750 [Homalodisca vitripennis]|nr:hypothetical protein J6590_010750 [Homalodisca vitripennis]
MNWFQFQQVGFQEPNLCPVMNPKRCSLFMASIVTCLPLPSLTYSSPVQSGPFRPFPRSLFI